MPYHPIDCFKHYSPILYRYLPTSVTQPLNLRTSQQYRNYNPLLPMVHLKAYSILKTKPVPQPVGARLFLNRRYKVLIFKLIKSIRLDLLQDVEVQLTSNTDNSKQRRNTRKTAGVLGALQTRAKHQGASKGGIEEEASSTEWSSFPAPGEASHRVSILFHDRRGTPAPSSRLEGRRTTVIGKAHPEQNCPGTRLPNGHERDEQHIAPSLP
jgi:hypothetical protein